MIIKMSGDGKHIDLQVRNGTENIYLYIESEYVQYFFVEFRKYFYFYRLQRNVARRFWWNWMAKSSC